MKTALISAMLAVVANPNADSIQLLQLEQQKPVAAAETTISVSTLAPILTLTGQVAEPHVSKAKSANDGLSAQLEARQTWHRGIGHAIQPAGLTAANRQSTSNAQEKQQLLGRKNWYLQLNQMEEASSTI
jgi:hypothetical protein